MEKTLKAKSALAAAMSTVDKNVEVPTRHVAGSVTSQIAALATNESYSKVQCVGGDMTISNFSASGATMKEELRNRITPSVAQAKAKTGGIYSIELGTMITSGNVIYIVAVVTRID